MIEFLDNRVLGGSNLDGVGGALAMDERCSDTGCRRAARRGRQALPGRGCL